jgi:hypothetical protein
VPSKQLAVLAAVLLVTGCSSDNLYDPQKFFPGKDRHGWEDCSAKFGPSGTGIQICAFYAPNTLAPTSYAMSFLIPNDEHIRLVVYDEHALLVKTLLDQDMTATLPIGPAHVVDWDFTDAKGHPVMPGDYRVYFRAGDYVSSSDVTAP